MPRQAVSVAGHFGEWVQGRSGPSGQIVLVTVVCDALRIAADWSRPFRSDLYSDAQLQEFSSALSLEPVWPGLESTIRIGCGAGASTATLVALARAHGLDIAPQQLAAACLAIEGATDPLMYPFPDRLLWASRDASVIEDLPPPPSALIVAGYWGEPQRTEPLDHGFPVVDDLLKDWRRAVADQDGARAAKIASASAERCTDLRGPDDPMADLARDVGAAGHLRAHTGSARGLVLSPDTDPAAAIKSATEAGLASVFTFRTGGA